VISGGEVAAEDYVAVQQRAYRIRDRVVHVVAFDQDSIEGSDASSPDEVAGSLEQSRQKRNTEGVYPFDDGGSPAASPTSRWAIANRVMESITSSTSLR